MSQLFFPFYGENKPNNFAIVAENKDAYRRVLFFLQQQYFVDSNLHSLILLGDRYSGKKHLLSHCQFVARKNFINIDMGDNFWRFASNQHYVLHNFASCQDADLLHLINIATEKKAFLLLVATTSIDFSLADLSSRLKNIEKTKIHNPSKDSLYAICCSILAEKQISIQQHILQNMLKTITTYEELFILLKKIEFFCLENNQKLNNNFLKK